MTARKKRTKKIKIKSTTPDCEHGDDAICEHCVVVGCTHCSGRKQPARASRQGAKASGEAWGLKRGGKIVVSNYGSGPFLFAHEAGAKRSRFALERVVRVRWTVEEIV